MSPYMRFCCQVPTLNETNRLSLAKEHEWLTGRTAPMGVYSRQRRPEPPLHTSSRSATLPSPLFVPFPQRSVNPHFSRARFLPSHCLPRSIPIVSSTSLTFSLNLFFFIFLLTPASPLYPLLIPHSRSLLLPHSFSSEESAKEQRRSGRNSTGESIYSEQKINLICYLVHE